MQNICMGKKIKLLLAMAFFTQNTLIMLQQENLLFFWIELHFSKLLHFEQTLRPLLMVAQSKRHISWNINRGGLQTCHLCRLMNEMQR